ncbi:MAG: hypothetical protein R3F34_12275 [Planctomycetota bacterium]
MGLLSFLGSRAERPSLQLYGKLPIAKDYLRVGCGEGSGRALREWLDGTFGSTREGGRPLVLSEGLRFFGQGEDGPLQGAIEPSTDAGGHRTFPFVVFVERRAQRLAKDVDEGVLVEAERVWRLLRTVRDECCAATDGMQLLARQRGREFDLTQDDSALFDTNDFDVWIETLWPDEGRAGLDDVLAGVADVAARRPNGPFRLPLVRECPMREQVVGWIRALRVLGALTDSKVPTVYFPGRSMVASIEPACAVLGGRPLGAREVDWIVAGPDEDLGEGDFASGSRGPSSADSEEGGAPERFLTALTGAAGRSVVPRAEPPAYPRLPPSG